ncbi:MAG: penicillin-insensitive murein endopeptidase [Myxococcota bacterium]
MWCWWIALDAAAAPRLLPWDEPAGDAEGEDLDWPELPDCEDLYPYRLVQLPARPGLYQRNDPARSWGTAALIDAIQGATARVALAFPDADPVFVGDLSTRRGGPLPPHRTHDDGRSVDVGLYFADGEQPLTGFVPADPDTLDAARTWTLIDGFLSTGRVRHILLDQDLTLRDYLLDDDLLTVDEVERIFPSGPASRRFAAHGIVRPAPNHRDHLHVRFRCE